MMPQRLPPLHGSRLYVPKGERSNAQDFCDSSRKLCQPRRHHRHLTPACPSPSHLAFGLLPSLNSLTSQIWGWFQSEMLGNLSTPSSPSVHTAPRMGAPFLLSPQLSQGPLGGVLAWLAAQGTSRSWNENLAAAPSVSLVLVQFNACR